MFTVIVLIALLILIFVLEAVLNKRRRNPADRDATSYGSGDSADDGTTASPAAGHHAHHSATDTGAHDGGHTDTGGFSGHGGFDGGGFGGHGH